MKNSIITSTNSSKFLKKGLKKSKLPVNLNVNIRRIKLKKCSNKIKWRISKIKSNFFKKGYFLIKHNKKLLINLKNLKYKQINKKNKKKSPFVKIARKNYIKFKKYSLSTLTPVKSAKLSFSLYNKFLLFIFRVGKKNIWEHKFSSIFDLLTLKLHYSKSLLLLKIFIRLFTRVEVKKVKARKRITHIPFFIKLPRSIFLALKWVFLAAVKKKGNISFQNKLFTELLQIITQKSSFSLQKVEENNILAFKNRSNIHYRWQKTR
jgi:ribosomal protein S7